MEVRNDTNRTVGRCRNRLAVKDNGQAWQGWRRMKDPVDRSGGFVKGKWRTCNWKESLLAL
jgi:hypothetical protein